MKLPEKLSLLLQARPVTRGHIALALGVAMAADGLQFALGPLGWAGLDQAIDMVAMALTIGVLGFHVLLLPTFLVELVPVLDSLPTWTACVAAVIALRKREQNQTTPPPLLKPGDKPTIDV